MFVYSALVDIGVSEKHNDDRATVNGRMLDSGEICGSTEEGYILAAVCDGAGGVRQGGRAAHISAELISQENRSGLTAGELRAAIEDINRRILEISDKEDAKGELMTTVAGVYISGEDFMVFNAGDSRVYRLRGQYLRQLSKDHSYVQDLVDIGKITPEEAQMHPNKNIINKFIGINDTVSPRIKEYTEDVLIGDIYMICSDGISDVLDKETIAGILVPHSRDAELSDACRALRDAAVSAGNLDNMTVILIRKEGEE